MKISIRVSVPDPKKFSDKRFRDKIASVLKEKTGPEIKKIFESTVSTWSNKPDFSTKYENSSDRIAVMVFSSGQNANLYRLVSLGSPPHRITARKGLLRFYTGYRSATMPRVLTSRPAMRGGNITQKEIVNHPGFEPREFPEALAEFYEDTFKDDMQNAMNDEAKQ